MNEETTEMVLAENWQAKALVIGSVIGASVGLLATYLLIQKNEGTAPPKLTAGEGVKIGVLVFGLLRSIANL